jgi:hypothetical protein
MAQQVTGTGSAALVQLIIAMAGTGSLVAVVQGLFTRRKTRAEVQETGASATKVITDAAAVIVSNMAADNVALRQENNRIDVEIARLREAVNWLTAWREAAERNMERHERWDADVAERLQECGSLHKFPSGPIGPPPPLRPVMATRPALPPG